MINSKVEKIISDFKNGRFQKFAGDVLQYSASIILLK